MTSSAARSTCVSIATALALLAMLGSAEASDLTGTYAGKWLDNNGQKFSTQDELALEVSQIETLPNRGTLHMSLDGLGYYFGGVVFDPKNPDSKSPGAVARAILLAAISFG